MAKNEDSFRYAINAKEKSAVLHKVAIKMAKNEDSFRYAINAKEKSAVFCKVATRVIGFATL